VAERPAGTVQPATELIPPASLHKPMVVFSDEHTQMCRAVIGDRFPDIALPDLEAKEHTIDGLRGDKLTVVVFWSLREALGREQFLRLQRETLGPFKSSGVHVVAVNVGDEVDQVRQAYQEAHAEFPCLLDHNKLAFTAVATGQLPRTYLLNGTGQILWMDIVYSRSTRRELANAIHYYLLEQKKRKPAG